MLAERTGTTVATIRYYEQVGLLRPAPRRGGQRIYDIEDERRLAFIRRCREFDLSIEAIGGQPLAGSGFETEEPELEFSSAELSGEE